MKLQRLAVAMVGVGMLASTAASIPAVAAGSGDPRPSLFSKMSGKADPKRQLTAAAAADCGNTVAWSSPTNQIEAVDVYAAKPPKAEAYEPFTFPVTKSNATWYLAQNASGTQLYFHGLFLNAGNLYRHTTIVPAEGAPRPTATKVGSGWSAFRSIATSNYSQTSPQRSYLYGLNTNGSLYRYAASGAGFKALGSFGGFGGFKTMTMISETATYDTLLFTNKAGALYTVRIPATATAKPVVKLVRSTGFADYESMVVTTCGTKGGSLVVGVDTDTDSGYQYAFSHANGTATAITSYGKVPATFTGTDAFALTGHYNQLFGE
jgi:hypothetical protein